ncbi:MAG: antitoxin component YwqK of YwqJK toxin-antitoxin module [Rhodothermales bacterium]|jgi:antitoxin component YwqK of YwqJK toxin-antitoxin module
MKTITLLVACLVLLAPAVTAQIALDDLMARDGLLHEAGATQAFTGAVETPGRLSGQVEQGLRHGTWTWYFPSGDRDYEIVYLDGKQSRRKGWHDGGSVKNRVDFMDGKPHGVAEVWDRNGILRNRVSYALGFRDGEDRLYDHTGALLLSVEYAQNVKHGAAVWWYADGTVRWRTAFESGQRTGTWAQYGTDGSLSMESTWEEGRLVSRNNPHAGH